MTIETTLPTNNETWGYWGTIDRSGHATDTAAAWTIAYKTIANATTCSAEGVRDFLDSRHGRHLADHVINELFAGRPLREAIELPPSAGWVGASAGA